MNRQETFRDFERAGPEQVQRILSLGHYQGELLQWAKEWLDLKSRESADRARSEEIELARRAASAAEDAAASARQANEVAREANSLAATSNELAASANSLSSRANNRSRDANKIAIAALIAAALSIAAQIIAPFLRAP